MQYVAKPRVLEVIQYNKTNVGACLALIGIIQSFTLGPPEVLEIQTIKGVIQIPMGDYILKDIEGNITTCSAELFDQLYEPK